MNIKNADNLFETLILIILDIYTEVVLQDHVVILFYIFWGASTLFFLIKYTSQWFKSAPPTSHTPTYSPSPW